MDSINLFRFPLRKKQSKPKRVCVCVYKCAHACACACEATHRGKTSLK